MELPFLTRRFDPRRLISIYSGLPHEIIVLFAAGIVNSLGQFVYPFLTLLLTTRLGMSPVEAGSVILGTSLAFVPGSIAGGKLADTIGRKQVLVGASLFSAALFVPCAFMGNSRLTLPLIVGANFFMGAVRPAITALVTDLTVEGQRQSAFSLLYLGHNMGFAIGPLVAGFLFNRHTAWLFLGDAATTVAAMLLVMLLVRDSKPDQSRMEKSGRLNPKERPEDGGILRVIVRRPYLIGFVFFTTALNLVYGQIAFSLPLQLNGLFDGGGPAAYGILMTTNAIVVISLTSPTVAVTRRFKPISNMAVVGALYAIGFGMIRLFTELPMLILSTVVWTVGEVIGATNIDSYIANHTPASHRGRMNSVAPIFLSLGFSVSPLLTGLYMERFPIRSVWVLSALLAAATTGAFLLLGRYERRGTEVSRARS